MTMPRVAAMVLARDRPEPLRRTLAALAAQERAADHLLVIDNDATPEVRAAIAEAAPEAEVLVLKRNLGCAGGFAAGIDRLLARGDWDYLCGFDDDATPEPDCLGALLAAAEHLPAMGAAGAVSHSADGTLAWPMHIDGRVDPLRTVGDADSAATAGLLPVATLSWHGLLLPVPVLRAHGNVWGELFLQYEDLELGLRLRRAGLRLYLVPEARVAHPPPPPTRELRVLGRHLDVTAQNVAKEYLTLRNGLVVRHRHEGARFWVTSLPMLLLRGVLSAMALPDPTLRALRQVVMRGAADALRGRLGPP